jgi:hypothetical protein
VSLSLVDGKSGGEACGSEKVAAIAKAAGAVSELRRVSSIVTTEAMVAEKPKPKTPPMPNGGGMGNMDYYPASLEPFFLPS